ncbi:MAG TPA: DUF4159 domain-containing protein [Flavobacteriaceae bacterium]|nr:DUF4159 domain-containing protein [Flavobacteriaceae bacterium]
MYRFVVIIIIMTCLSVGVKAQEIATLKYGGGGDWYANPTALPNLIKFCNQNINTKISENPATVETGSVEIFQYPYIYMTGHGNVFFNETDIENLRNYLLSGGFLHVDDNYGLDIFLRPELKKLFPEKELIELPAHHHIFNVYYKFPNGIPKIHEHDNKPPQAFGIFENDRLVLLYTYETDLGNGWENQEMHNNPEEVRQKALQMGANIIKYAFEN